MVTKDFPLTKDTYGTFFGDASWNEVLQMYYEMKNLAEHRRDTALAKFAILGALSAYNELERRFSEAPSGKEEK